MKYLLILLFAGLAYAGGSPISSVRNVYSTTPVTSAAYVTLFASMPGSSVGSTHMWLSDTSGQAMVISAAPTCGALAKTANSFYYAGATNQVGNLDFSVSPGWCVGIEAAGTSATTGELDLNFQR